MKTEKEIKEELKPLLEQLKVKYPDKDFISISYNGSGDSFNSMWVTNHYDIDESDIEDICWVLIENSNASFDNDGSEGEICIDLKNMTVSLDNYYIYYERNLSDSLKYNLNSNDSDE